MGLIKLPSVPDELHRELKSEAAILGANLTSYIMAILAARVKPGGMNGRATQGMDAQDSGGKTKRTGNGTTVPILPKTKGKAQRLHPLQPLRPELGSVVAGHNAAPEPDHKGHSTFGAGARRWCSTCRVYY